MRELTDSRWMKRISWFLRLALVKTAQKNSSEPMGIEKPWQTELLECVN